MNHQIETRCIHGNGAFSYEEAARAVSFPIIYQTATFGLEHMDDIINDLARTLED